MYKPKSVDEYLDLVDQAIYEIEELLLCAEDESEAYDFDFSELTPVYRQIEKELKKLHGDILAGRHVFANDEDLVFMPWVRRFGERIPFRTLLEALNAAHRAGFDA